MEELFSFRGYELPVGLVNKHGGTSTFEKISDWHLAQLQKYIGIKETDNVVEIGCGIGRAAIPLTQILTSGSYIGTETIRPSIEWCAANITLRHPNFEFIHHDIRDTLHNPKGKLHATDIRLPSVDGSVDLIMLHSVFTHMFEEEIVHYFKEFGRILKPTGRVWASCFLYNYACLDAVRDNPQPGWRVQFKQPYGDRCFVNSEQEPRSAVAFHDDKFMDMIRRGGLHIEDVLYGTWSGTRSNARNGQDAVILSKPSNAEPGLEQHILEVNRHHKMLKEKVEALVRYANGNRRIVYQTTLSDGGEVKLRNDVAPLFKDARVFQDRWKLSEHCANILTAEGQSLDCIVEVGVETGVYSSFLADLMSPSKMLLLDLRFTLFQESNYRACMSKVEGFSSKTLPTLEDDSISFAYIDAAHDFKNVSEDIENILPKMKKNGIIQFNDYATFNLRYAAPYGVKAAVNTLINSGRVSVVGHGLCPLGFDDVAVRVL